MTSLAETDEPPGKLRTYSSIKDASNKVSWLKEDNYNTWISRGRNAGSRFALTAAFSACAEHRWENAAEILPFLFLQIENIPMDILLSFTNVIVQNNDSLSHLKDTIYEKFIPWLSSRNYVTVLGLIGEELPNIKHEDLPAFLEKIGRLCTKAENMTGKKCKEKLNRLKFLSFGYTALIIYYFYRKDYEQEWGELQFLSETKPDDDFQEDEMDMKEKARKKAVTGLKEALQKFSWAFHICDEPCEWLMEPYLHTLKVVQGNKAALEELEKYVGNNPIHLPAHRLAYKFLKSCPDTEELQQKELEEIVKLCPDDPLVITYVEGLLEKGNDVETLIKVINLLMDMIEFKEWRWDVKPWKTLCYAVGSIHVKLKYGSSDESGKIKGELQHILEERAPLWKACVWNLPTFSQVSFDQAEILFYSTYVAFVLQYDKTYSDHMKKNFVDYGYKVLVEDLENAKKCSKRHLDSFLENFTAYKESHRSLHGKEGEFSNIKTQNSDNNNRRKDDKSLKCNNDVSLGVEEPLNFKGIHFNDADFVTSTQASDSPHEIPLSKELETCKSPASVNLFQDSYLDFSAEIPCGQKDPVLEKEEITKRAPDYRNDIEKTKFYNPELFDHNFVNSQKRSGNEQHSSSDSDLTDMESGILPSHATDLTFSPKMLSKSSSKTKKDLLDITVANSFSETDSESSSFDMYSSLTGLTPSRCVSRNKSQDVGNATFIVKTESSEKESERWATSGLNESCHEDFINSSKNIDSFIDESDVSTDVRPEIPFIDMNSYMQDCEDENLRDIKPNSVSKSGRKKNCAISPNCNLPADPLTVGDLMSPVKVKTELRDDDEICDEPTDKTKKRTSNSLNVSMQMSNKLSTYEVDDQNVPPYPSRMKNRTNNNTKKIDCENLMASGKEKENSVKHSGLTNKDRGSVRKGKNQSSSTNGNCKSDKKKKSYIPKGSSAKHRRISVYDLDDLPFPVFPSQDINGDSVDKEEYFVEGNRPIKKDESFIDLEPRDDVDLNTSCHKKRQREIESVEIGIILAEVKEDIGGQLYNENSASKSNSVIKIKKTDKNKTKKSRTPKSSLKKSKRISLYDVDDLPFPFFSSQDTKEDNDGISDQKFSKSPDTNTLVGKANESKKFNSVGNESKEIHSEAKKKDGSCEKDKQYSSPKNNSPLPIKSQKNHVKNKDVTPKSSLKKIKKSKSYGVGELPAQEVESQTILGEYAKAKVSDKTPKECVPKSGKFSSNGKKLKKTLVSSTDKTPKECVPKSGKFSSNGKKLKKALLSSTDKTPKECVLKSGKFSSNGKKLKKALLSSTKEGQNTSIYEVDDLPFPDFDSQEVLENCVKEELYGETPKLNSKENSSQSRSKKKSSSKISRKKYKNSSSFEVDDLPFPIFESQAVLEDVDELKFSCKTNNKNALDSTKCMGQSKRKKQITPTSSLIKNQKSFVYELDDLPIPVFDLQTTFEDSFEKEVIEKSFEELANNSDEYSSSKRKNKMSKSALKKQEVSFYELDDLPFPVFESQCLLEKSECDPVRDFEGQSPVVKNENISSKKKKKKASKTLESSANKNCENTQFSIENRCEMSRKLIQSDNVKPEKNSSENRKRCLSQKSLGKKNSSENLEWCHSQKSLGEINSSENQKQCLSQKSLGKKNSSENLERCHSQKSLGEKNSSENLKQCLSQKSLGKNIECGNVQRSENYVGENSEVDFGIEIKQEKEDSYDDFICIPRYIRSDSGVGKLFNEVHTLDSSFNGDTSCDDGDRYSEVNESPSCINQHLKGNVYPYNVTDKKNNKIMKDTKTHLFCSTPVESACVSKKAPFTVLKGKEDINKELKNLTEEVGARKHMDLDDNDISKISCTVGTKRGIENVITPEEAHQTKRLKTKDFSLQKSKSNKSDSPVFTTKKSGTVGTKRVLENELTPQEGRPAKRLKTMDFPLLKSNTIKSETPIFASKCKSRLGKKLFTPGGISKCLDGSKNKSSLLNYSGYKASMEDSPESKMVDASTQKRIGKIIGNDDNITKDSKAKCNEEMSENRSKGLALKNDDEVVSSGIEKVYSRVKTDDSGHNSVSVKKKWKIEELDENDITVIKIKNKTKMKKLIKSKLKEKNRDITVIKMKYNRKKNRLIKKKLKKIRKKLKKRENSECLVTN